MAKQKYDSDLQMLVEDPKDWGDIDLNRLWFLRWTVENYHKSTTENGVLMHDGMAVSQPSGQIVDFIAEKAKREAEEQAAA